MLVDIPSLLVSFALLLIVLGFVLRPVMSTAPSRFLMREQHAESEALLSRRAAALEALTDLDFDHATGKIGREDYLTERQLLVAQGIEILKQLDDAGISVDRYEG